MSGFSKSEKSVLAISLHWLLSGSVKNIGNPSIAAATAGLEL
jgi:hypothetical protein